MISGATKAKEIIIWTDRLLRSSRTAIASESAMTPAIISFSQRRPFATARNNLSHYST
jgi:hypothetical protein